MVSFFWLSTFTLLEYLLELTSKIDKAAIGLDVEKLIITPDSIVLKAQVKDYDALRTLEHDLEQSKLFYLEQKVHDPKFTMVLRFKKNKARERAK